MAHLVSQRYPPIPPTDLTEQQKINYEFMNNFITSYFGDAGFLTHDPETGALVGPFAPLLYLPLETVRMFCQIAVGVGHIPDFNVECREIAILTVGQHHGAEFELYAHTRIAQKATGLSDMQIRDVLDGKQPRACTEQEAVAWEVSRALIRAEGRAKKGALEEGLWQRAEAAFGKTGVQALVHYVGTYAYTCVLLNGCAVELPHGEKMLPDLKE